MEMEVGALTGRSLAKERLTRGASHGYRDRDWRTRAGTVELHILKLRKGSCFPGFPESAADGREGAHRGDP